MTRRPASSRPAEEAHTPAAVGLLRRVPLALALSLAAVVALLFTASPASATISGHGFAFTAGDAGPTSATNVEDTYPLSNPAGVAIDTSGDSSTGDLYVTDPANHRVEKFDSEGHFLLMFGKEVNATTGGDVCPEQNGDVCQEGEESTEPGGFVTPTWVAVDNSPGPSKGDVYVGDAEEYTAVQKFEPSGHLITSWAESGQLWGSPTTEFEEYFGIATDAHGDLYVINYENELFKFNQAGTFEGIAEEELRGQHNAGIVVDSHEDIYYGNFAPSNSLRKYSPFPSVELLGEPVSGSTEAPSGFAVDPSSNQLYVDRHGTSIRVYNSTCNKESEPNCTLREEFGSGHLTAARGVAVNPETDTLYVANSGAHNVAVFKPIITPDVEVFPVSDSTPTSVMLNGEVRLAGGPDVTECYFEYGTVENLYTETVPCSPNPDEDPPTSNFEVPTRVHAEISGLTLHTIYHYRLVTGSANGTTHGSDQVAIATPDLPSVDGTSSSNVTQSTATLNANINPGFGATIFRFQYGQTAAYGAQTYPSESIGEDGVDHPVSTEIVNLTPGNTYHFRVLATNLTGTTYGPDQTLTTPAQPTVKDSSAFGVTRTTATLGAEINPNLSPTTYHFDYGTTGAYGSSTPQSTSIGSDNSIHTTSRGLAGLVPGTIYHYRVVATNEVGTTDGPDRTFVTEAPEKAGPPPIVCRKGYVKRHGKCVKKPKPRHHRRRRSNA